MPKPGFWTFVFGFLAQVAIHAPGRLRHLSCSFPPRQIPLYFCLETQLAAAREGTIHGLGLHLQDFPSKCPFTALCTGLGLPLEGMCRVDGTDLAGCSLSSELQGSSSFLVLVTRTLFSLVISLIGAILKIIPFLLLTYFWLHYFPNRITECQSWKEDHLVHLQMKEQAQRGDLLKSGKQWQSYPRARMPWLLSCLMFRPLVSIVSHLFI